MEQDRNRYLRERVSVEWVLDQPNRAAPGRRNCLSTEKKDCPSLTREVALLTWPHRPDALPALRRRVGQETIQKARTVRAVEPPAVSNIPSITALATQAEALPQKQ